MGRNAKKQIENTLESRQINGDNAAFPMNFEYSGETKDGIPAINTKTAFGLTKRELIAAMNMSQMIAANWTDYETASKVSIKAADTLLKNLNR